MVTGGLRLNTWFPDPNGSLCPRTEPYVFVSAGFENGDNTGLSTELLTDGKGEYIDLGASSEKLAPITIGSPIKVPEVNQDSVSELDNLKITVSDALDTSGITSQVSFGQLGQKSISSPGY